jgi:hypothetical protein
LPREMGRVTELPMREDLRWETESLGGQRGCGGWATKWKAGGEDVGTEGGDVGTEGGDVGGGGWCRQGAEGGDEG